MKNKLYQPMDPHDAINYIFDNQYDSPRKMICTARKLAADICTVFDQELTVMLLEAIHNEDYVLVLGNGVGIFKSHKTAHIFHDDSLSTAFRNNLHHCLEAGTIKPRTGNTIIGKMLIVLYAVSASIILEQLFLVEYAV